MSAILPDTLNKAWARDKSRFGFAMLAKMGWQEGKGLGRNEDGMVNNIRVAKRTEALGIGAAPATSGGEAALTAAVSDYNALLAQLSSSAVGTIVRPTTKVGDGRIIARFARRGVLRQKNVAAYSAADLAAVLGTSVVGGRGGAGVAVALPDAPELRIVHRSERERKKEKKRAREEEEAEAEEEEEEGEGEGAKLTAIKEEADDDAIMRKAAKKWAKRASKAAAMAAAAEEKEGEDEEEEDKEEKVAKTMKTDKKKKAAK